MELPQQSQISSEKDADDLPFFTKLIATGIFSGYIPWASGTFGSLAGLIIYFIPGAEQPALLGALIILGFGAGVVCSAKVSRAIGHRLTSSAAATKKIFQHNTHSTPDPSIIVIDEIVGMWVSLFLLPKSIWIICTAFCLFRAYDIMKPPPARQLEKIPDGWGIMLDDVAAGIYANLTVRLVVLLFPRVL
ncbi:MAG TPA: phosphatidylglycerophosphatase A [Bacteroidota bacterium]|jgi:phosphatidylglycerophosphatase A|nr:phosphatidylglycerophosphatase A [Bacteroidota bacterium]